MKKMPANFAGIFHCGDEIYFGAAQ